VKFKTDDENYLYLIDTYGHYIQRLARVEEIARVPQSEKVPAAAVAVVEKVELFVPLAGLIDLEVERQRLNKEIQRLEKQIAGLEKKLANEQFLTRAPERVVEQERNKLTSFKEKLEKLRHNIQQLSE
jgi:valyl-tRNA synthetase